VKNTNNRYDQKKHCFSNRVINVWKVVTAGTVNTSVIDWQEVK